MFYFYTPDPNYKTPSYFYISFKIEKEEHLKNLTDYVDNNYYTLNHEEINYINLNNLEEEIILFNFKNITNFFVTLDINHIIPFERMCFKISFAENISFTGKILGYNLLTKKYEELKDNDLFQINDTYFSLNYILSEKEKSNHGAHIKISIITYNSPDQLNISQTVSNLGIYEYYFYQNNYKICDSEFYLNCISEFICYENCPIKVYNETNKCNYCHHECKTCSEIFNEKSNNCLSCSSTDKYLKLGNCVSNCSNGYYNDTKDPSIKKCKCDLENCFICSLESLSENNSCITCNVEKGFFPLYEDVINNKTFIKCYKKIVGYYFDDNDHLFKKCYQSCQECDIKGNETYHNCLECKDNYDKIILYDLYKNCYINCSYYYYFDKNLSTIICTKNFECPEKYDKLILGTNQCIDECNEVLRYKFRNECFVSCPEGTIKSENKSFYCEVICQKEKPFELIDKQICVEYCNSKLLKNNTCILKYETKKTNINNNTIEEQENDDNNEYQDLILENFDKGITSDDFDTSDLDNGEDEVYEDEKMTITITTTDNQKNNSNTNLTSIDLGECEILLREYYNISEEKKLYIIKKDIYLAGMKIPKIEYDIYCKLTGANLIKLNKSICENTKINLLIPVTISEDINKLNSSSEYYNDIYHPSTSDEGTDIILNDRKKEFIENNKTVCQDDCVFSEYDYNYQKATCSCKVQESSSFFKDININTTLLYNNFVNIKNIANTKILACYKTLFSKNGILKNIGFYIVIILLLIHTINSILFYTRDTKIIEHNINKITFGIQNWKLVIQDNKEKMLIFKSKKKNKNMINNNDINDIIIEEKESQESKESKESKEDDQSKENEEKKTRILFPSINQREIKIKSYKYKNNSNPLIKKIKRKIIKRIKKADIIPGNSTSIRKINEEIPNKEKIETVKKIMEYNNVELNDLSFKLALKYDHRSYCQYYLSLLKSNHILISALNNSEDYNSRVIKFDLFFVSFALYYTVNALFFSDETMHTIYVQKGYYNFIYQLPQIVYSFIISTILNAILKVLALSGETLIDYKHKKDINGLFERKSELESKLRKKFVAYFSLGFALLFIFWYYLSMFCAIYRNTQTHLIKDTLICFVLSLFYPIMIYLIPGMFRMCVLDDKQSKKKYLYALSKLFQKF